MRLKLSVMDLSEDRIANNICEIMDKNNFLQDLDISRTKLQSHQLLNIAKTLLSRPDKIRKLNFANNELEFQEEEGEILNPKKKCA